MLDQMHLHPEYQMSLEEIDKFLYFTEKSGYSFNYRYTGGEPLYWKHLEEGTRMLTSSKSCKSLLLMTNAMKPKALTKKIVSMIDYIRISQYGYNHKAMRIVKETYPDKVHIVDREEFYPHPTSPINNATPVECGNFEHLYFKGKVFACPHSYALAVRHKMNMDETELGVDLCLNYCERNTQIREGHENICKLCIGNKKVRDQMGKVENVSLVHLANKKVL